MSDKQKQYTQAMGHLMRLKNEIHELIVPVKKHRTKEVRHLVKQLEANVSSEFENWNIEELAQIGSELINYESNREVNPLADLNSALMDVMLWCNRLNEIVTGEQSEFDKQMSAIVASVTQ
jgi:hypothetical protein